jgi:SAM-dependent methyltransferase
VLDVGTGCGDTPRRLVDWARRGSVDLFVKGIDLSPATVAHARQRCRGYRHIDVECLDLFELPEHERYDVVHASLVLHHLSDDAVVEALGKMYRLSRLGVVINDLHRHWAGHVASRLVLPLISRDPMVRHDGPLSILRAFRARELEELTARAGLPTPRLAWWPMFRWQMILRREEV